MIVHVCLIAMTSSSPPGVGGRSKLEDHAKCGEPLQGQVGLERDVTGGLHLPDQEECYFDCDVFSDPGTSGQVTQLQL